MEVMFAKESKPMCEPILVMFKRALVPNDMTSGITISEGLTAPLMA